MHSLVRTTLAVAAGAAVASIGGAIAVSAATSNPASSPSSPHGLHRGWHHLPRMAGVITAESSSGGLFGKGEFTVTAPDGKTLTLSLTPKATIWLYHGPGVKPTREAVSDLAKDEVVVVTGKGLFSSRHLARHVLDLGIQATSPG